jgi:hypothetical protein
LAAPLQDARAGALEAPVFFLSYGRTHSVNRQVIRIYQDLCLHVRQLVGSRAGANPGFIDQSMGGGQNWDGEIFDAVISAPVFVALLSVDYFDSRWCAMEWDAFSRRRPVSKRDGSVMQRSVTLLPVSWSHVNPAETPWVVQEVQRFSPDFHTDAMLLESYLDNGIYGLLVSGSDYYDAVVWQLARRITDLYHNYEVPRGDPAVKGQLRTAFKKTEEVE